MRAARAPLQMDGHRDAVHLQRLGLVGVGGLSRLHAGPLVGLFEMGLGPVGAEGAQKQPRHHALVVLQGRERAHEGDEGVGAGVEQVVVPEGAQGDVLGAVGPQRHAPRLLPLAQAQGVVAGVQLPDAGLGVVGGELAPHHLVVEAAGHEGHAVHVGGQLQGEGFGNGDGAEHVLDSQQRSLPGPWRRHRQQHGGLPASVVSEQQVLRVQLHRGCLPFSTGLFLRSRLSYLCWPGLHSMTSVSSGVASMRTGKRLPFASSNPSPLGHDRSHRWRSWGRSKASPTVLMAAASC